MPLTDTFSIDKACIDFLSQLKFYVMLLKQVSPGYFAILYTEYVWYAVFQTMCTTMHISYFSIDLHTILFKNYLLEMNQTVLGHSETLSRRHKSLFIVKRNGSQP